MKTFLKRILDVSLWIGLIYLTAHFFHDRRFVLFSVMFLFLVYYVILHYDCFILSLVFKAHRREQRDRQFSLTSYLIFPFILDRHNKSWSHYFRGMASYFSDDYAASSKYLLRCLESSNFDHDYPAHIFLIKSLIERGEKQKAYEVFTRFNQKKADNEITNHEYFRKAYDEMQSFFNDISENRS
jgi:hypothetical protein